MPLAVRLAEENDVRLAIHCHGDYLFGGSVDESDQLLPWAVPAWCLLAGGNPVIWVRRWSGRIHGVHF